MGNKRKQEEGSAGLVSQNSNVKKSPAEFDSDSDEGYACEAPDKDGSSSKSSTYAEKQKADTGPSFKHRKVNATTSVPSATQSSSAATSAKGLAIPVLIRNANVPGVRQDDGDAKSALQVKKETATIKSSVPLRPGDWSGRSYYFHLFAEDRFAFAELTFTSISAGI